MDLREQLRELVGKWQADSNALRLEARRLELLDLSRHATSIAILEAGAEAIDRCIMEIRQMA